MDRPRDDLLVERPEILERAAAASQDQHVAVRALAGEANCRRDLGGRARSLHLHRVDENRDRAEAPLEHVQDIAYRGAGGRSNDADAPRKLRERLLVLDIEQAFRGELRLQDLEFAPKSAFACFLYVVEDELIVAALLVKAHAPASLDVHSILGREAGEQIPLPEHGAADLRRFVLQREVPVARGRARKVRNLALDPKRRQPPLEQNPGLAIEPRRGIDVAGLGLGRRRGGCNGWGK